VLIVHARDRGGGEGPEGLGLVHPEQGAALAVDVAAGLGQGVLILRFLDLLGKLVKGQVLQAE
jgi:hypothetical protein